MNILLIWPNFPRTFWSYNDALALIDKKALMPPLGLITIAAQLPQDWIFRVVDCNVTEISQSDWDWADAAFLSAMLVQKEAFANLIASAKAASLPVIVGGPYVTSLPDEAEDMGADYIVQDESEVTLAPFVTEFMANPTWTRGADVAAKRFTAKGEKPDLDQTPIPRFDLLDMAAYDTFAVQYSRGCPFLCEFCDIISLYGRVPRTKPVDRMLAEFQALYDIGWRGRIFVVDDNFIGNKKNVKTLLRALSAWQAAHGHPFQLSTEASIDLAADEELVDLMVESGFNFAFLGIETPDAESLELTRKHQNNRKSMSASVADLHRKGIGVRAGFIVGFDNEKPGADQRIVDFVEKTNIPQAFMSMLQALPNTALFQRLEREGRLMDITASGGQNQLTNFVPTRPLAELAQEYMAILDTLYTPKPYFDRCRRFVFELSRHTPAHARKPALPETGQSYWTRLKTRWVFNRAGLRIIWQYGLTGRDAATFWKCLTQVLLYRREYTVLFFTMIAQLEHFMNLAKETRGLINQQLENPVTRAKPATFIFEPRKAGRQAKVQHM